MRHKTVTVLFVVIAALAATPQAFRQLSSLKDAAGNRVVAGVWNMFLSLQGRKLEGAAPVRRLPQAVAEPAPAAEVASHGARGERASARNGRAARRTAPAAAGERFPAVHVEAELAALEHAGRLLSFDAHFDAGAIPRAPQPPVRVHLPAGLLDQEALTKAAKVLRLGKTFKGMEMPRVQGGRQRQKEVSWQWETRRAAEVAPTPPAPYAGRPELCPAPAAVPSCQGAVEELTYE